MENKKTKRDSAIEKDLATINTLTGRPFTDFLSREHWMSIDDWTYAEMPINAMIAMNIHQFLKLSKEHVQVYDAQSKHHPRFEHLQHISLLKTNSDRSVVAIIFRDERHFPSVNKNALLQVAYWGFWPAKLHSIIRVRAPKQASKNKINRLLPITDTSSPTKEDKCWLDDHKNQLDPELFPQIRTNATGSGQVRKPGSHRNNH